jgi:hypothetical protein
MNQQIATALAELPGFPMAATQPSAAHSRKCCVCHHPDRVWIELKFIEWDSPTRIADEFELYDTDCIYRHAHATNLFEQRRRNILCIYEHILERFEHTVTTNRDLMTAVGRIERAVRSRLPNPAAEIAATITRETRLIFDPKSDSEEDQGCGAEPEEPEESEAADEEREQNEPNQSAKPAAECASQCANSDLPERQHTPADLPDSKAPETPESRHSAKNEPPDLEAILETQFVQVRPRKRFLDAALELHELKRRH